MPKHFLITKAFPVFAIALIYWIGSFNLPSVIFLPIALIIAASVFYVARKHGNKEEQQKEEKVKEKQ